MLYSSFIPIPTHHSIVSMIGLVTQFRRGARDDDDAKYDGVQYPSRHGWMGPWSMTRSTIKGLQGEPPKDDGPRSPSLSMLDACGEDHLNAAHHDACLMLISITLFTPAPC